MLRILVVTIVIAIFWFPSESRAEDLAPLYDESATPLLYRPVDLAWDAQGFAYVLCQGDATVSVFSHDWMWDRQFGTAGQGPGEMEEPVALIVHDGEVWIGNGRHILIYDRTGTYLREYRVDGEVLGMVSSKLDVIVARNHEGTCGLRLTKDGAITTSFGPKTQQIRAVKDVFRATSWVPMEISSKVYFVNLYDALLWNPDKPVSNKSLGLVRGRVDPGKFKFIISDVCVIPDSGFLVLHYPKVSGGAFLIRFDSEGREEFRRRLETETPPGMVRISPDGEVIVWSESVGVLYRLQHPGKLTESDSEP